MAVPPLRVGAAQMTSTNDLESNYNTCAQLVKEAAAAGVHLLCFPESFSFVGAKVGESLEIAEPLDGPIMKRYCSLAREANMWLSLGGFQEKGLDDTHLYNTHVLVDCTGNVRNVYRKIHLMRINLENDLGIGCGRLMEDARQRIERLAEGLRRSEGGEAHRRLLRPGEVGSLRSETDGVSWLFLLQAPKGDISYLQKFFLMYVGNRFPLHLQEDFCSTALLSAEWIRSDSRRTAVGVDMDLEALNWCLDNNLRKIGADGYSRISLFCGNVLQPQEARIVKHRVEDLVQGLDIDGSDNHSQQCGNNSTMKNVMLPNRDIICAFNYSCCCLQRRKDLVLYFKHALNALSKRGGIFVMDLYGTSSERKLHLQRRFSSFTYIWEQQEFDILNRRTRISIHFHLGKQRTIRHAFSYDWRLWSLPEVKDCLEEAGFQSVHFWIKKMADTEDGCIMDQSVGREVKYEEFPSFHQQDAWNAYIIGVANA